jgi:hypothetical protein
MLWIIDNNEDNHGQPRPVFVLIWSEEHDGSLHSYTFDYPDARGLADQIANDEYVPAIKYIRDVTALGLKEAKDAFDYLKSVLTVFVSKPARKIVESFYVREEVR